MKIKYLAAVLAASFIAAGAARAVVDENNLQIKPGDQVITVQIQNEKQLQLLRDLDLDIWSHEYGVGPVDVHASVAQRDQLTKTGITFTVKNPDLMATRAREIAEINQRSAGDFTAYKDLNGLIAYINNLATTRPDICSVSSFGTSLEGRSMYVLKITGPNPGPKPAVFYHGLIHAREWIAGPVALYLAEYLTTHYDTDPCIADLVNKTEIYICPCVNPDGYNYTWATNRMWRKNRRNNGDGTFGVDNNRNFDYQWGVIPGGGSSSNGADDDYRGPLAFSEPETQNIRDFILNHPNIKAYIDYHSYSQLLMWPWGYTPNLSPDDAKFAAIGNFAERLLSSVNGVAYAAGPINTTIYQANGTTVDWAYGAANRFAFTTELRDTGTNGFLLPAAQILPTCQENLQTMLYLTRWSCYGILVDPVGTIPTQVNAGMSTNLTININNAQENYVAGSALLNYRFNSGDPFSTVPFTLLSGTTYAAVMPAASCGQTAEFYITASGSGGSSAQLPCGAPATLYSAPVVQAQLLYSVPLNSSPGWTLGSGWAFGTPTGVCGDPSSGHTGTNVYGYNLSGCYTNNLSTRYLTTTAFNCSGFSGIQLRFWRWLGMEAGIFDHAVVQVSNNNSTWTTVWNHVGPTFNDAAWTFQSFDISAVADNKATVYIRWGLSSDGGVTGSGWNIDDVEIVGKPIVNCGGITIGDVNQDGVVNGLDIGPFVSVLLNPSVATSTQTCAADINQNCGVTIEDVAPFVALLLGA